MKITHWDNALRNMIGFALVFAGLAGAVHAAKPQEDFYPWDPRAPECTRVKPSAPWCSDNHWGDQLTATTRITHLYMGARFVLLERALTELSNSDKYYSSGSSWAGVPYAAFRQLMPGSGGVQVQQERERIRIWKVAVPNSYFAVFAEARLAYADAWNARGSSASRGVSPESWQLFDRRLQEAAAILDKAPKELKELRMWHSLMLAIALDERAADSNKAVKTFQAAVTRWPREYPLYDVLLTRLVPRWGGSWETVESFISHWSQQQRATEGTSLYARLYINLPAYPHETAMDWGKMKVSLEDLSKRYPDGKFANLYASYACFARDKPTYLKAMSELGQQINPNIWLEGHSFEACRQWAAK